MGSGEVSVFRKNIGWLVELTHLENKDSNWRWLEMFLLKGKEEIRPEIISLRLNRRLFFLSQQLMKHQRIQVKSKKDLDSRDSSPAKICNSPSTKKNTNVFFELFPKTKHLSINHRKKTPSISHPPTIDFLVGSLQIHRQIEESNHKPPAMYRCHWYHS